MRFIKYLVVFFILLFSFWNNINCVAWNDDSNLKTWNSNWSNSISNSHLNSLKSWDDNLFGVSEWWEISLRDSLFKIAKDLKSIFFVIAWLYFLIITIKLIFAENTEEEIWKFKKWIIWISLWIMIMQIAYSFVSILYDNDIEYNLAEKFVDWIISPLTTLLQTGAAFFFIAVAIFSFFRMVTANWDEEKIKSWKMSVFYSIVWFVIIKIASNIVDTIYWIYSCSATDTCVRQENLSWAISVLAKVLNWANSFIWLIVVILIIYTGFQVIFSIWDEEVLKKAKKTILYIILWLILLFANYLILTFFIVPSSNFNPII